MSQIAAQVHDQFKLFTGVLQPDRTLGPLAKEIADFVATNKVAAKSLGMEYLESAKRLVISLGYHTAEPWYPVAITCVGLGKAADLTGKSLGALEQALAAASAKVPNIICHDLYITDDKEFLVVFMSHQL